MTNKIMTTNGAMLDSKTMAAIRKLATSAASLHRVEGDSLGVLAREVLAALPEPYVPPPPVERGCWRRKRREARAAEARTAGEWWAVKDKPEREQ